MPRFTLVPTNNPAKAHEFVAKDAGAALDIASQKKIAEADLWQAGKYVCTFRRSSPATGGYWMIVQSDNPASPPPGKNKRKAR